MILLKTDCSSKEDFITKLVEQVCNTKLEVYISQKDLLAEIFRRENIGGSLLPSGLSIPHARIKGFNDFIIAIGTPKKPLFHEGQPIYMMAMIISNEFGEPYYLPTLAGLAKLSRDQEYFSRLCKADSFEGFVRILRERDPELA